ncbi:MAG: DsbC family protein [Proteobacteria bacterium]|nr:DsbC family protein [Pseudomonadota bacterium]
MSIRKLLQLSLITFMVHVSLVDAKTDEGTADQIRSALKQQFSGIEIDDIKLSPIKGLYEVRAGSTILYVTQDAQYALSGDIIDLKNAQTNLTEEVRKQARLNGLKRLGQENMIVFSPKNPKYTVTVFTDVDCGYCRKMQNEMKQINDLGIAIRYLAFPRTGPNTPTYEKMVAVWCAKNKNTALADAKADKQIDLTACTNNSVTKDFQFGMQIGVAGTPTLIFEDGTMIPGYLPPNKLLEVAKHLGEKKASS